MALLHGSKAESLSSIIESDDLYVKLKDVAQDGVIVAVAL